MALLPIPTRRSFHTRRELRDPHPTNSIADAPSLMALTIPNSMLRRENDHNPQSGMKRTTGRPHKRENKNRKASPTFWEILQKIPSPFPVVHLTPNFLEKWPRQQCVCMGVGHLALFNTQPLLWLLSNCRNFTIDLELFSTLSTPYLLDYRIVSHPSHSQVILPSLLQTATLEQDFPLLFPILCLVSPMPPCRSLSCHSFSNGPGSSATSWWAFRPYKGMRSSSHPVPL